MTFKKSLLMPKLIRITTVPLSLKLLLAGQMKFMKANGWEVYMVSSNGSEVQQVIKAEGVNHIVIPFTRQITPIKDLLCIWQLYRLFKREKPDIVHTHTPKAGFLGMIAARIAGQKIRIHTLAGIRYMVASGKKRRLLSAVERWTFASATEVWPNSEGLKSFVIEEKLCDAEKLTVIGNGSSNGVDMEKFSRNMLKENHLVAATMRILPKDDEYIILAVGRLVQDKGIEELVYAFLDSKIYSSSKLVLLGSFEQDLDPISIELLTEIRDNPRIIQINWTDHVAHYMALADVLVHASHREGFPNVLLEAGAMELPVICSDIMGNKDLIIQQKTGLIFPVKDKSVLKEALEFAFVKREIMAQYAKNLYMEVQKNYNRELIHEALLANYNRLLESQSS